MECPAEDFQHPEKSYKKPLFWARDGAFPTSQTDKWAHIKDHEIGAPGSKPHELCWICGWTNYQQYFSTYVSRVKVFHNRDNTALWNLGPKLILKDAPNDGYSPGNDYITQKFLRAQPNLKNIPLVKKMELLSEPTDKTQFVVMSRAEGKPLGDLWFGLSQDQKDHVRDQLVAFLRELRQFTASGAQTVDGGPLDDLLVANCSVVKPKCLKIGFNNDEWFENFSTEVKLGIALQLKTKDPEKIDARFQELKSNFPKSEPYVLTHGDLTFGNIMVKEDDLTITAIIDWEYAGYYPWWAERWLCLKQNRDGSHELTESVFEVLHQPSGDLDTFREQAHRKILPVTDAWDHCTKQHPGYRNKWFRSEFSESEPYAGTFRLCQMGGLTEKREHVLNTDALDRVTSKDPKSHRLYL